MPKLTLADTLEIGFYSKLGSQVGITRIRFGVTATGNGGIDDFKIPALLNALFGTAYKACLNTNATFLGFSAQIIYPTKGVKFFSAVGTGQGAVPGEPLPPQTASLLNYTAEAPGRRKYGRSYIPFPGEGSNDTNARPSAAHKTNLEEFGTAVLSTNDLQDGANTSTIVGYVCDPAGVRNGRITQTRAGLAWSQQKRRSFVRRADLAPLGL